MEIIRPKSKIENSEKVINKIIETTERYLDYKSKRTEIIPHAEEDFKNDLYNIVVNGLYEGKEFFIYITMSYQYQEYLELKKQFEK
jgi:hypothetical protein